MYTNLWGYPCVQLIGSEGPIGCTTTTSGEYGWIYPIESQEEFDDFVKKGHSGPIVVVVASDIFIKENIVKLDSKEIKGILVYKRYIPQGGYSPGDKNPNRKYGLYPNSTMMWNPNGDSWNYALQPFSIFAIDNNTLSYLRPYLEYNKETSTYPKHAIKLNNHMNTRIDADVATCLRRHDCAPLGGKNIWALLSPLKNDQEIVLAISSMDANGFFHDLAPGADVISGTVALLAAIEALSHVDQSEFKKQPMFAIFNGEQYGYIGSKAFVHDLQNFTCVEYKNTSAGVIAYCHYPFRGDLHFTDLSLTQFSSIIEFNQVGQISSEGNLFVHTDSLNAENSQNIIAHFTAAALNTGIKVGYAPKNQELPGSSLMSFLSANRSQPGIVITEYQSEFVNSYYQSIYDNSSLINFDGLCKASSVFARTIFSLATDGAPIPDELSADCLIIEELYSCLTNKYNCKYVKELYPTLTYKGKLPPVSNYVGTYERSQHNFLTEFVRDWIANITATNRSTDCEKNSNCSGGEECISGKCLSGYQAYYHDALSPAFEYQYGVGYVIVDDNPSWPQWTESYWDSLYLTVFWMDWPWLGYIVFTVGVIEFVLCLVFVFLMIKFVEKHIKNE